MNNKEIVANLQNLLTKKANTSNIASGKSIIKNNDVKLKDINYETGLAEFTVNSSSYYNTKYKTRIFNFAQSNSTATCTCDYDWGGYCKHIAAVLLYLMEHIQNQAPVIKSKTYAMANNEVYLPDLQDHHLINLTSKEIWKIRNNIKLITIVEAMNGVAKVEVDYKKNGFALEFSKSKTKNYIHTACSCQQELPVQLCEHKIVALLKLRNDYGLHAFEMFKDWDLEKNRALAPYGFSLNDKIDDKFEFKVTDKGALNLIVKDPSIQPISNDWRKQVAIFNKKVAIEPLEAIAEPDNSRHLLYAIDFTDISSYFFDFKIDAYTFQYAKTGNKISYLKPFYSNLYSYNITEEMPDLDEKDRKIRVITQKIRRDYMVQKLAKAGLLSNQYYYSYSYWKDLSDEAQRFAYELIGRIIDTIFPLLEGKNLYLQTDPHGVKSANQLLELKINFEPPRLELVLEEDSDFVTFVAFVYLSNEKLSLNKFFAFKHNFWLTIYNGTLYRWSNFNHAWLAKMLQGSDGKLKIRKSGFEGFLRDFILPLTEKFDIEFKVDLDISNSPLQVNEARIYLKEDENNLLIVPAYAYKMNDEIIEFEQDGRTEKVSYTENRKIILWERDGAWEQDIFNFLESLHPNFAYQKGQSYFYIAFNDVLKDGWLFNFFEAVKTKNLAVFGFKELKKLRYNPNRPNFQMRTSSGIDWFDMTMELSFGDQFVSLSDLKKAVLNRQNYVQLKDGTLGILPEEWIEQHRNLFKFGTLKGDNLKISKLHFNLIDELLAQVDNLAIQEELAEKKRKLLNFKEIQNIDLPTNVNAQLREYQKEGYKWLNFLNEFNWGGCLADDMGLGKTLQVLTLLQNRKNQKPQGVHLVVVPTSLIFNWQAEAEKFCPSLRMFVYRGVSRKKATDEFENYDIILTTYGTLRSDIEIFKEFEFDYIVLDESQAIKNPTAQISKAVRLLKANNRLTMTGTPIENNTFDLYSQFEFLNPGFLGSEEFFKEEFANPIDKHQDKEKSQQLRKMLYPFMLKRTKEEVATDLPDKTETILYCEMGKEQKKVYETFRELYRQKIAGKLMTDGKEKSSFLILEGLLKLRQICDSPALLSGDEDYGKDSTKLDELIRELEENASNHKTLIFSQFLGMLNLVREQLEKRNIIYEYLDGQTVDRAAKVKRFQTDKGCRVFLMSLKAGGVGLNLTAADYVYLIDPWWNPAVEAQAIDRTHRIGQDKKVFAYKMICKDTIEEKILTLQKRKQDLAEDLVGAETGFIKKLSQEDILDLFS
ncbi:MAG: SNF2-related protein [Microscillaceae bacterium]|jgi:non-specific serine/threonine protein kinase|nr:SNF2-related protein [Microscillaceae bacterium]